MLVFGVSSFLFGGSRYDRDGESGGQIGVCYAGRNAVNVNELSRMCGRYHTASKNCVFVLHTENI